MSSFCCRLRERFLIGVIAENPKVVVRPDDVDWTLSTKGEPPVIRIAFCPFCGQAVDGQPVRTPKEGA